MNKNKYEGLLKPGNTDGEALERLISIIEILRVECPWDKEQTHESLKQCLIEEAYEVCEAIDRKDGANLREELGDVLLQVVFHSSLCKEKEMFGMESVINDECEKMIRRHPHVFSDEDTKSVDKVLEKWENIKSKEHTFNKKGDVLDNIPLALPALIRSYKIQRNASKVGFDWENINGAYEKLEEETKEVKFAYENESDDEVFEEIGDLLFSVVNVARFMGVNPEDALMAANNKFIERFKFIERNANENGKEFEELTLEEMDFYWSKSKE